MTLLKALNKKLVLSLSFFLGIHASWSDITFSEEKPLSGRLYSGKNFQPGEASALIERNKLFQNRLNVRILEERKTLSLRFGKENTLGDLAMFLNERGYKGSAFTTTFADYYKEVKDPKTLLSLFDPSKKFTYDFPAYTLMWQ